MPIATCILSPSVSEKLGSVTSLIELWGKHSGLDTSEMTIMVLRGNEQLGKEYLAVSTLNLPTMWSPKSINSLQVGLSNAISEYYDLEISKVIVMTSLIEPSYVVEGGEVIEW